jgi:putative membrane protein
VLQILALAGWRLLWLVPLHVIPLACYGIAWRVLLAGTARPGYAYFTWGAIVREAVAGLLPVARIGGEVVGVRLLVRRRVPTSLASASVLVELSLTIAAQTVFAATGLGLLTSMPAEGSASSAGRLVLIGLLLSVVALAAFVVVVRRWGPRVFTWVLAIVKKLGGGPGESTAEGAAKFQAALERLFSDRRALALCGGWQLIGFFLQSVEMWVMLRILGAPATARSAIVLESLTNAVQSASFLVPGGLGTQEGGFLLFGAALGITPQVALALSLARRVRQLLLGVPGLLSWAWVERRTVT